MRIKLVVEYDGTDFRLSKTAGKEDGGPGAGGSHFSSYRRRGTGNRLGKDRCRGPCPGPVVVDTQAAIPPDRYGPAINTFLPSDIRIVSSEEAAPDFHPRYQARWKTYRYLVYRTTAGYTLYRRHAYQYTGRLDLNLIKEGIRYTAGTHDFRGFMAAGSAVQDTVRTVCEFTAEEKTPWLKFEITGDGFLYKMVRNLVGTLLEIGRGAMSFEQLEEVMRTGNRTLAGPTAPARGLYLVNVDY